MMPHPAVPDVITLRERRGTLRETTSAGRHPPSATAKVAVAPARTRALPRPLAGRYTAAGEVVKEITDRVLAAVGLVLVAPLLLAVAVAIRLDSKGPALFRQVRLGRRGRPFTFYKFRGMYRDARERFPELYAYRYSAEQIRDLHFHLANDPRVTRVGRLIRHTSLDELPNLINVVLGEMSLVGPRPEIPEMIPYYGEAAREVLSVKPGVTSLAKLVGRDNLDFADTLAMDVKYVRTRSLALDVRLLLGTVSMVFTGRSVGF